MKTVEKQRIVVVGGGFAGIAAMQTLQKKSKNTELILVSAHDSFVYYPALYRLVTGALPIEVSLPLSVIFPKGVTLISGVFSSIDTQTKTIRLANEQCISYDYAVIALGSETNYFNIPGLPEHSFSFKSVSEALRLKQHIHDTVLKAKTYLEEKKTTEALAALHVIIVGGGPSGVELAGDIKEYMQIVAKEQSVQPQLVTVDIVEAAPRLLPTLSEKVSEVAEKRLRALGINIFTSRALQSQEMEKIALGDMDVKTATVIWTAGTRINSAYTSSGQFTFTERKRVAVGPTLAIENDPYVFVAGDGAGTQYSGLAQTAMYDGTYVANCIVAMMKREVPAQYAPKLPGFAIPIGSHWALFSYKNILCTGYIPWILRNSIDFHYFTSIVSLRYVINVFLEGRKYRKHGGVVHNKKYDKK